MEVVTRRRHEPLHERCVNVYESDGFWTRGLRRQLPTIPIQECPGLAADAPLRPPASANVLIVSPATLNGACRFLRVRHDLVRAPLNLAVVPRGDPQALAWILREQGVVMTWESTSELRAVGGLIRKFWQQNPPPDLSLEERIWKNLPWSGLQS